MALTKAELESIISQLQDMPPPSDEERVLSHQEVIARVRPVIKKLRGKGYLPEQIQAILESSGLKISKHQVEQTTRKRRYTRKTKDSKPKTETGSQGGGKERSNPGKENEPLDGQDRYQEPPHKTGRDKKASDQIRKPSPGSSHFTPDPDQEDI